MAVEMGEGVDWVDKSWYQVDEVLGRVVVERKVDAHEELPDEAKWYSKAIRRCVKFASATKVSPDRKRRRLPRRVRMRQYGCDESPKKSGKRTSQYQRDSVPC